MALQDKQIGKELLNVPMGEMIRSMAMAIAAAQWELDKSSMTTAEMMSGRRVLRNLQDGSIIFGKDGTPQILDTRVAFGYTLDYDKKAKMPEVEFYREMEKFMLDLARIYGGESTPNGPTGQ